MVSSKRIWEVFFMLMPFLVLCAFVESLRWVGLVSLVVFCIAAAFYRLRPRPPPFAPKPCPTLIIIGSGGHTSEMLTIAQDLNARLYSPRIYVISHTDYLSHNKILDLEGTRRDFRCEIVHRIREVGQGWTSTFFKSLPKSLWQSFMIFKVNKPALILCNGPGICVPFCIIGAVYKAIFGAYCSIIYVESICRVTRLSMSGMIVRPFVDQFVVQWTELMDTSNKYFGRLS